MDIDDSIEWLIGVRLGALLVLYIYSHGAPIK